MNPSNIEPRSLRSNFGAATIGNVMYSGSQFGMLWALARFTSVADVGRYALALAITGPVFILTGLKLRQVQVTDAAGDYTFGQYLALRLATSALGLLAVIAIAYLFPFPAVTMQVLIAVGVYKTVESVIDICYGAIQHREQLHLVARSMVIRSITGLTAFAGTLALTHNVVLAVISLTVLTLWQLAVVTWRVHAMSVSVRPGFDRKIVNLARLSLPLGVSVSVGSLSVNVPRYLIELKQSTVALGVYAALSYPLVATATIAGALVDAASPRLSKMYYAGETANFRRTTFKLIFLGASLGMIGVIAAATVGRFALLVVFGPIYAASSNVLTLLMVAAAIEYTSVFIGTAVNAMRMFTVQAPISIVSLLAVFLIGLIAVPRMGLTGAAIAVIAGQLVQCLGYMFLLCFVILPKLDQIDRLDHVGQLPKERA